jgi:hypothetical protein
MEHTAKDHSQINGWGVDADPKNDPTYPMRNRNNDEHAGYGWERPPQQPIAIAGLSGAIRRVAFKYSESSYGHWLPLMLADRVGVMEGVLSDLKHGHVPNVFAEGGWKAEWGHNKGRLVLRTLARVALVSAAVAYFGGRRTNSHREG